MKEEGEEKVKEVEEEVKNKEVKREEKEVEPQPMAPEKRKTEDEENSLDKRDGGRDGGNSLDKRDGGNGSKKELQPSAAQLKKDQACRSWEQKGWHWQPKDLGKRSSSSSSAGPSGLNSARHGLDKRSGASSSAGHDLDKRSWPSSSADHDLDKRYWYQPQRRKATTDRYFLPLLPEWVVLDYHQTLEVDDEVDQRSLEKLKQAGLNIWVVSYGGWKRNSTTARILAPYKEEKLIDNISFTSTKCGATGKAALLKAWRVDYIFDDSPEVCLECEKMGFTVYRIGWKHDGHKAYRTLADAVDDFLDSHADN